MTCIAVRRERDYIHLCWDTQITEWFFTWDIKKDKEFQGKSKMYSINNIVFGWAWDMYDILRFKQFIETNLPKWDRLDDIENYMLKFYTEIKEKDWSWYPENEYILIYNWKIFLIRSYDIYEIDEYTSIWSWWVVARTLLHIGKSAKEAVGIARELADWVWWETEEIKIDL